MSTTRRIILLAATALPVAAAAQDAVITGTASYRERIALRPGAVLEVELQEISRADAPSERIASVRVPVTGQVPIPFTLPYDPARIAQRGRYALRARLLYGERVAFRTDRVYPVLSGGAQQGPVEILLVRAHDTAAAPDPAAGLVGQAWTAEDIGGRGVVDRLQTTMTLDGQGRAHGNAGCNGYSGGYELDGATLRFGQVISTQRACAPAAMDQERRFHEALAGVRGWRLDGAILHLTGEGGAPLLRFARQ